MSQSGARSGGAGLALDHEASEDGAAHDEDLAHEQASAVAGELRGGIFVGVPPETHVVRLADERLWAAEDRAKKAEMELRTLRAKEDHVEFWHAMERKLALGKRRSEQIVARGPRSTFTGLREERRTSSARGGASGPYSSRHGATVPRYAGAAQPRQPDAYLAGTSVASEDLTKPDPQTLLRGDLEAAEARKASARWPAERRGGTLAQPSGLFRVGTALNRSTAPLAAEPEWRQLQRSNPAFPSSAASMAASGAASARPSSRAGMGFILPSEHGDWGSSRASTPRQTSRGGSANIMPGRTQKSHPWLKHRPPRPTTAPRPDGLSRTPTVRTSGIGCATTLGTATMGGVVMGPPPPPRPSWQPVPSPRSAREASVTSMQQARDDRGWRTQDVHESHVVRRVPRPEGTAMFEDALSRVGTGFARGH